MNDLCNRYEDELQKAQDEVCKEEQESLNEMEKEYDEKKKEIEERKKIWLLRVIGDIPEKEKRLEEIRNILYEEQKRKGRMKCHMVIFLRQLW